MADISLNAVVFDKTAAVTGNYWKPVAIERTRSKAGRTLIAADGTPTQITRGEKWHWTITWEKVPATTRDAIRTIYELDTTFIYHDEQAVDWTVMCLDGDFSDATSYVKATNEQYYDVTLTIHQA